MSIEERLVRDIAAVTRGVVVTEAELLEAHYAVTERIRHKRRRTVLAAAAAAALLVAGGVTAFLTLDDDDKAVLPADPGPSVSVPAPDPDFLTGRAPTDQRVHGIWRLDDGGVQVKFDAVDGTFRLDDRGALFSNPLIAGTYEIDGDVITMTPTDGCTGTPFAWRASLPQRGNMNFIRSGGAGECTAVRPWAGQVRGDLEQLLPTSSDLAEADVSSTARGWRPLRGDAELYGVWLAGGGGYVLEMARDGSYYVAGESSDLVDRGQWTFRNNQLTLTSSARSTVCSAGHRLVLGGLEYVNPGTSIVRGTVEQNTCRAAWTPAAWILIPNALTG